MVVMGIMIVVVKIGFHIMMLMVMLLAILRHRCKITKLLNGSKKKWLNQQLQHSDHKSNGCYGIYRYYLLNPKGTKRKCDTVTKLLLLTGNCHVYD